MQTRKLTKTVSVGNHKTGIIKIGGDAQVSVQSMTAGYTYDIDSCVAEINRLQNAGADMVRIAVPEKADTAAIPEILNQTNIPIIADVHFHFARAIESIDAGVHKIRLNPGNINDQKQVNRVIDACKDQNIPIRIGVNEGSIVERKDKQKRMAELTKVFSDQKHGHLISIMITKLEEYIDIFQQRNFDDIVISAKSIDPAICIDAYTAISQRFDYPLHLGVTHAGPKETGSIRSIVGIGTLLANGIGDTIRISYADDPVEEVKDALEMLYCLGLRNRIGPELIACPSCGRIQVDLFKLVKEVKEKLDAEIELPIKVAVMGCIVNGPGEAEGADVAIFAGDRRGIIYVQGQRVANVPEDEILERLLKECKLFEYKVKSGEAKLGEKTVNIIPPDQITIENKPVS